MLANSLVEISPVAQTAWRWELKDNVVEELTSYCNLPTGWDCGIGGPLSQSVVDQAIELYIGTREPIFENECSPFSDNSIELSFFLKDLFLVLTFKDNQIRLSYEIGIGNNYKTIFKEAPTSLKTVRKYLYDIKDSCLSLERYTSASIKKKEDDFQEYFQTMETASLSSNIIVQNVPPSQFVNILTGFIPA